MVLKGSQAGFSEVPSGSQGFSVVLMVSEGLSMVFKGSLRC